MFNNIQIEMPKRTLPRPFPYSTKQVAKMMPNSKVTGDINLRKFLREENILEGNYPLQEYIDCGYFIMESRLLPNRTWIEVIRVSTSGYIFIKELVIEKLGIEEINVKTKSNRK